MGYTGIGDAIAKIDMPVYYDHQTVMQEERERAVLAVMLHSPETAFSLMPVVLAAEQRCVVGAFGRIFNDVKHEAIWHAMKAIYAKTDSNRNVINLVSVVEQLRIDAGGVAEPYSGWGAFVHEISSNSVYVKLANTVESHLDALVEFAVARCIMSMMQQAMTDVLRDPRDAYVIKDRIQREFSEITKAASDTSGSAAINELLAVVRSGEKPTGIRTGIVDIDAHMHPIGKGRVMGLIGGTGGGKSAFAVTIMCNNLRAGKRVAYYTGEMSRSEIIERVMSNLTGIPLKCFVSNEFSDEQREHLEQFAASGVIDFDNLDVIDANLTVAGIFSRALADRNREPDLLIIDQLPLIVPSQQYGSEELKLGSTAYEVKAFARTFDIPVILLHQANQKVDENGDPEIGSSRGTQQLPHACDYFAAIRRLFTDDGMPSGEFSFSMLKSRQGKPFKTLLSDYLFRAIFASAVPNQEPWTRGMDRCYDFEGVCGDV